MIDTNLCLQCQSGYENKDFNCLKCPENCSSCSDGYCYLLCQIGTYEDY
jgi:hypothetical protein